MDKDDYRSLTKKELSDIKGIYIHIPFCDGKCYYCSFYSILYEEEIANSYIDCLLQEIGFYYGVAPYTIYIGGGTPSILNIEQWNKLFAAIKTNFSLERLEEWTVEINPTANLQTLLDIFRENRVNRISVGVQSVREDVLRWLGRRHTNEDSIRTIETLKNSNFKNFNIDLIAGVPILKVEEWEKEIEDVLLFEPLHISVYMLTAEEDSILANEIKSKKQQLLNEEEEIAILKKTEQILENKGLKRYEISNYAKENFECKHNCLYWKCEKYIGIGVAAASFIGNKRITNVADIAKYVKALNAGKTPPCHIEKLSDLDIRIDKLIFGLRMMEGVPVELAVGFEKKIDCLINEGLLSLKDSRIVLTESGRLLADYVAKELFTFDKFK